MSQHMQFWSGSSWEIRPQFYFKIKFQDYEYDH
jgi:hypothetical protein